MTSHHPREVAPIELRVAALEKLLNEAGLIPEGFIEETIHKYEEDIGPMNGAKVVAQAWVDPGFKSRLLNDAPKAIKELGFDDDESHSLVVVENTQSIHNVVVCTLCSCYPWPLLGLPPKWYKDSPYRARVVREPRKVLSEMGCELPENIEIRVWDSSAEQRYLVLATRPEGSENLSFDELVNLVSRDSMIGVARL